MIGPLLTKILFTTMALGLAGGITAAIVLM